MSTKKKEKFSGQVTVTRAIKIFEALGFKTAKQWDRPRLQKKINKGFPEQAEGTKLDRKMQKRVNEILRALKQGRKIIVVDVADAAADAKREQEVKDAGKREVARKADKKVKDGKKEKAEVKKTAKKVVAKKQAKKAVAVAKEKKGVSKFGSRSGTIKASIDSVLTKKPKTMEQLLKDAKVDNQQNGHLKNLIEAGYVVKSDKGFALV